MHPGFIPVKKGFAHNPIIGKSWKLIFSIKSWMSRILNKKRFNSRIEGIDKSGMKGGFHINQ